MERERDIEKYLRAKLAGMDCLFLKFTSPGNDGVPDRLLITPEGEVSFVELKTADGYLESMQQYWIKKLRRMNCNAFVVYGKTGADELIAVMQRKLYGVKGGDAE